VGDLVTPLPNPLWKSQSSDPGVFPNQNSPHGAPISNAQGVTYSLATDAYFRGYALKIALSSATNLGGVTSTGKVSCQAGDMISMTGRFSTDGGVGMQAQLVINGETYKPMAISAGTAITHGNYHLEVVAPSAGTVLFVVISMSTGTGVIRWSSRSC
jgi:hypothetical protein